MKFSNMFIPTSKKDPADATLISHKYLVRAGFIDQQGSGLYNFLPLGKIVLDKIIKIIKEELDNAQYNEVQLSFVTPMSLWEESGRALTMDKELLRFTDRKKSSYVLSPTNEEAMVNLVKNKISSYKQLPINLYQINTKFRDELRPRFGLMRCREFLMKDAYSFHDTKESLEEEFLKMENVYKNIFTKLGINFRVVSADSGVIGGEGSKEFMVIANSGEDTILVCNKCDYGANIETIIDKDKLVDLSYDEIKEIFTKKNEKLCPKCSETLEITKGIEAGHIFQLGTKYSKIMQANFLDKNGKSKPFEMGCYGIGVSRLIATMIEQNHDEKGCKWSISTAPFMVCIIVSSANKENEINIGLEIYNKLKQVNISVIIDDRKKERFGFKMKDFELIGLPYAIIIGKKIQDNIVEVVDRKTFRTIDVDISNGINEIVSIITNKQT